MDETVEDALSPQVNRQLTGFGSDGYTRLADAGLKRQVVCRVWNNGQVRASLIFEHR